MADGFLGRWSRRKAEAREGRAVEAEPPAVAKPPQDEVRPAIATGMTAPVAAPAEPAGTEPLPTLEDVKQLTGDEDFSRFVAPKVAPEVKNAALRKLFSDPRFNVMDGMDVYIDDYSKPDPLPESMLRQLASAKFLGMFQEEPKAAPPGEVANDPTGQTVAQSGGPATEEARPEVHADPDLRLQPDDAPAGEEPRERPE